MSAARTARTAGPFGVRSRREDDDGAIAARPLGRDRAPRIPGFRFTIVPGARSYRLGIVVARRLEIAIGRLGPCVFPAGSYAYVGSARRAMAARIRRHLGEGRQRLHWHVDYLLTAPGVRIDAIDTFDANECDLVLATGGRVVVADFGASDCRRGCVSHLRYFGRRAGGSR